MTESPEPTSEPYGPGDDDHLFDLTSAVEELAEQVSTLRSELTHRRRASTGWLLAMVIVVSILSSWFTDFHTHQCSAQGPITPGQQVACDVLFPFSSHPFLEDQISSRGQLYEERLKALIAETIRETLATSPPPPSTSTSPSTLPPSTTPPPPSTSP